MLAHVQLKFYIAYDSSHLTKILLYNETDNFLLYIKNENFRPKKFRRKNFGGKTFGQTFLSGKTFGHVFLTIFYQISA